MNSCFIVRYRVMSNYAQLELSDGIRGAVFSISGVFSRHCALIHYTMRLPKKIFVVFINRLLMLSIPMPGCKCMCVY